MPRGSRGTEGSGHPRLPCLTPLSEERQLEHPEAPPRQTGPGLARFLERRGAKGGVICPPAPQEAHQENLSGQTRSPLLFPRRQRLTSSDHTPPTAGTDQARGSWGQLGTAWQAAPLPAALGDPVGSGLWTGPSAYALPLGGTS